MAELDTSSGGGKHKGGKVRSKKMSTRVDLTAMVDLAFLLITFFMLTTTLSKKKAMDLAMPNNEKKRRPIARGSYAHHDYIIRQPQQARMVHGRTRQIGSYR